MTTSTIKRTNAAAFRTINGVLTLIQPSLEEMAAPDRDLWLFKIETGWSDGSKTVALFGGGEWYSRETVEAGQEWHQTRTLADWLRRAAF